MSFYVNPSIETLCEMTDYLLKINIVIMHDMSFMYDPYVVNCDKSCVDNNFITVCKRGVHDVEIRR